MVKQLFRRAVASIFVVSTLLACSATAQKQELSERQKVAMAMFNDRCKKAGEFIHRTAENVEGVLLMKVRPAGINYGDQYELDDPYGRDLAGKGGYIESFLRGSREAGSGKPVPISELKHGYSYVDAVDPDDGLRYRYTGHLEEPWQTNKAYLKGYIRFVVTRARSPVAEPRYGVTYDDISTRQERDYWIAGSSLKVVDLQTHEVMAERVGYMVDPFQGSQAGGRSPWLLAARTACPSFPGGAASGQGEQTDRFVEKVLKPKQ